MRTATIAALFLAAIVAGLLAFGGRDNPLTERAGAYARGIATTSAASYITLRTLNAFLSTAQEVEVGGSLFVSGNVQPLKVLEPIDDTVERLAGAIFVVMTATAVIAVALGPVGAGGWILLALGLVAAAIEMARGGGRAALSRPLLVYGAMLALALPLSFVIAAEVADAMTGNVWAENQRIVAEITRGVADMAEADPAADPGWFARLSEPFDSVAEYRALAASIFARADELVESFVMILAVFLFRVFVLPLLILGAFWAVLRQVARRA